jgi:hypothetical protein
MNKAIFILNLEILTTRKFSRRVEDGYTSSVQEEGWAWEARLVRREDTTWAPLK